METDGAGETRTEADAQAKTWLRLLRNELAKESIFVTQHEEAVDRQLRRAYEYGAAAASSRIAQLLAQKSALMEAIEPFVTKLAPPKQDWENLARVYEQVKKDS